MGVACWLVGVGALAPSASRPRIRMNGLERGIAALAHTAGVIQIDAENVRGKSGFRLGHDALLAATAEWVRAHYVAARPERRGRAGGGGLRRRLARGLAAVDDALSV